MVHGRDHATVPNGANYPAAHRLTLRIRNVWPDIRTVTTPC